MFPRDCGKTSHQIWLKFWRNVSDVVFFWIGWWVEVALVYETIWKAVKSNLKKQCIRFFQAYYRDISGKTVEKRLGLIEAHESESVDSVHSAHSSIRAQITPYQTCQTCMGVIHFEHNQWFRNAYRAYK